MSIDIEPPAAAAGSEPARQAEVSARPASARRIPESALAATKKTPVPLGPVIIAGALAFASGELVLFHWAGLVVALVVNAALVATVLLVIGLRRRSTRRARRAALPGGRPGPGMRRRSAGPLGLGAGPDGRPGGLRGLLPTGRSGGAGAGRHGSAFASKVRSGLSRLTPSGRPAPAAGSPAGRRGLFGRRSPAAPGGGGSAGLAGLRPPSTGRSGAAGRSGGGVRTGSSTRSLRSRMPSWMGGTRPNSGASARGAGTGSGRSASAGSTPRRSVGDRWRQFRNDIKEAARVPAEPKPTPSPKATPAGKPAPDNSPSPPATESTPAAGHGTPRPATPPVAANPAPPPRHAEPVPARPTPQGGTVSHPIRDAADQAKSAAAAYKPESLQKWGRDLAHLPDSIRAFADSIDMIRRHGDENLPAHKSLIEHLGSTVKLMREAASASDMLPGSYRSMHETDEDRLETPRGGSRVIEARADVSRAQDEI